MNSYLDEHRDRNKQSQEMKEWSKSCYLQQGRSLWCYFQSSPSVKKGRWMLHSGLIGTLTEENILRMDTFLSMPSLISQLKMEDCGQFPEHV